MRKKSVAAIGREIQCKRPLNHQRENLRWSPDAQISAAPVRSALLQRKPTLINGIYLGYLGDAWGGRHGHVCITASFCQNLHLVIHAAAAPPLGIRQRKIAMHESVARQALAVPLRETSVLSGQIVAEFDDLFFGVLARIGRIHPVVQVYFDFSPACTAVIGQALNDVRIVLFSREKVRVVKRSTIGIPPRTQNSWNLPAPNLQSSFLFVLVRAGTALIRNNTRLKMVCEAKEQMEAARYRRPPPQPLPKIGGQPSRVLPDLFYVQVLPPRAYREYHLFP